MANVLVNEASLEAIADAIREKNGSQDTYTPGEMADAIEAISGGGGITPTGTIEITQNGTYNVTNYASADVDVPSGGITPTGTVNITQNGTTDVTQYASASVNVPNSYSASDEGKVVSSGELVAQTSATYTANDTYDTTTIDSVTVNVSATGNLIYELGQFTLNSDATPTLANAVAVSHNLGVVPEVVLVWTEDWTSEDLPSYSTASAVGYLMLCNVIGLPQRLTSSVTTPYGMQVSMNLASNGDAVQLSTPSSASYIQKAPTASYFYYSRTASNYYWRKNVTYKYLVAARRTT